MTFYRCILFTIATAILLDWQVMLHAHNPSARCLEEFRELDIDQNGEFSATASKREKVLIGWIDANKDRELTLREVGNHLHGGGKLRPITTPKEIADDFITAMPVSLRSSCAATEYPRGSGDHAGLARVAGVTAYENYHNGWSVKAARRFASGTTSFADVAVDVSVNERLFEFDHPISETLSQWKDDPQPALATIRHFLSLTSGIDPRDNSIATPYRQAIEAIAKHRHRTKFESAPNPFQMLEDLIQRRLPPPSRSKLDYLQQRVIEPICMRIRPWRETRDGDPHVQPLVFLTARDLVKSWRTPAAEWSPESELGFHGDRPLPTPSREVKAERNEE